MDNKISSVVHYMQFEFLTIAGHNMDVSIWDKSTDTIRNKIRKQIVVQVTLQVEDNLKKELS
jgi:uncharacterized protein YccT (UPF0319 family)